MSWTESSQQCLAPGESVVTIQGLLEKSESLTPNQGSLYWEMQLRLWQQHFLWYFETLECFVLQEACRHAGSKQSSDQCWGPHGRRFHCAVLQSLKTKAFFRARSSLAKSNPSLVFGVTPESCNGGCSISGTSTCNLTVFSSNIQIILLSTTWKRRIMARGKNPEVLC